MDLAVARAEVALLREELTHVHAALMAALSNPTTVNVGATEPHGPSGPGFSLLAKQAMAAHEPDDAQAPPAPPRVKREVHWFRADGTDPNADPTPTPDPADKE